MITAGNIKNKTFTPEKNGYSQAEVDSFLSQLATEFSVLQAQNQESEEKLSRLAARVDEMSENEDAIKEVLLKAQKEANKIIADAKNKSKDMIESAKSEQMKLAEQSAAECEKIVREHKERCAQLIKENTEITEKKITALREAYEEEKYAYDDLRAEVTYFKANLTGLYNEQIKLVMQLPTLTNEELEAYENSLEDEYYDDEEYEPEAEVAEQAAAAEAAVEAVVEPTEEAPQTADEKIDKILNTGSFDPVIPKSNFNNLQFGKNN